MRNYQVQSLIFGSDGPRVLMVHDGLAARYEVRNILY
jgi:hypothetical protein